MTTLARYSAATAGRCQCSPAYSGKEGRIVCLFRTYDPAQVSEVAADLGCDPHSVNEQVLAYGRAPDDLRPFRRLSRVVDAPKPRRSLIGVGSETAKAGSTGREEREGKKERRGR